MDRLEAVEALMEGKTLTHPDMPEGEVI